MAILDVVNVRKIYSTRFGGNQYEAVKQMNFQVEEGEFIAIMGPSGSGKTTLLNMMASLDTPTEGRIFLDGQDMTKIKPKDISAFRRNNLGFVFQDFNLLDTFSIKDNILLPLVLSRTPYKVMEQRLDLVSKQLDIQELLDKFPYEVSGGEKQRAAVARALITEPKLVLADEPTGALDSKNSTNLMNIFKNFNEFGQTVLMVTHSAEAAAYASRVIFIKDGRLYHQLYRGNLTTDQMYGKIINSMAVLTSGGEADA